MYTPSAKNTKAVSSVSETRYQGSNPGCCLWTEGLKTHNAEDAQIAVLIGIFNRLKSVQMESTQVSSY